MELPNPTPVLDLIQAFRRSKTMFTAVSLGIFDRLGDGGAAGPSSIALTMEHLVILDVDKPPLPDIVRWCPHDKISHLLSTCYKVYIFYRHLFSITYAGLYLTFSASTRLWRAGIWQFRKFKG